MGYDAKKNFGLFDAKPLWRSKQINFSTEFEPYMFTGVSGSREIFISIGADLEKIK